MSSKNVKLYLCGVNFLLFTYFSFEQYLVRGAQFSEAGLNRALMKRKNNTRNNNRLKKKGTTKYRENTGGSIWLGSKMPF